MRILVALGCLAAVACSANPPPASPGPGTAVHVVVGATGPVSIAGTPVTDATFTNVAGAALRKHRVALIDADANVPFRVVASVTERLKQAGAEHVGTGIVIGNALATGTPGAPPAIPHATVAETTRWDCAFPNGGTKDSASVLLKVLVEPDGKAAKVDVLEDPGHGFAKAAETCALAKRYEPAKDANGASMMASTFPFYVRFVTR